MTMTTYVHAETGETVDFAAGSFYAEIADESSQWIAAGGDARPKRNGSRDEWLAYAIAQGIPSYEAAALSRDELVERMGDHPDVDDAPPPASDIVTDTPAEGDA